VGPTKFRDCGECPEMVVIPAGSFQMGSPKDEPGRPSKDSTLRDSESPVHLVNVQTFSMGRFEITRKQFEMFLAETNGGSSGKWPQPRRFRQDETHPVVDLTWLEAKEYTVWLSKKTGKPYRLPTEAEWEYAARAGTATPRYWGATLDSACAYENIADATASATKSARARNPANCTDGFAYTAPVGSFKPNPFGLYDMLGNVQEFTEDCVHLANYEGAPADGSVWYTGKPPRPISGSDDVATSIANMWSGENCEMRIVRGGDWDVSPQEAVRAAHRGAIAKHDRPGYGFRVVVSPR
jgi:formylglycine-generating enzyme